MYCPNCGKKIAANSQFCPYCGHKILNNNLHNIERKLGPKSPKSPVINTHDYNPKHISKKAKILFGCILAAAIIGGGIHHYHYRQTPASVNLSQQMSNKDYHIGSFYKDIMLASNNNLTNSDEQLAKHIRGHFKDGTMQLQSQGHTNSSIFNYSTNGKNLTLTMSSDSDSGDNGSAEFDLKLVHANENHKDLTFKFTHVSGSDASQASDQAMLNKLNRHKVTFTQDNN